MTRTTSAADAATCLGAGARAGTGGAVHAKPACAPRRRGRPALLLVRRPAKPQSATKTKRRPLLTRCGSRPPTPPPAARRPKTPHPQNSAAPKHYTPKHDADDCSPGVVPALQHRHHPPARVPHEPRCQVAVALGRHVALAQPVALDGVEAGADDDELGVKRAYDGLQDQIIRGLGGGGGNAMTVSVVTWLAYRLRGNEMTNAGSNELNDGLQDQVVRGLRGGAAARACVWSTFEGDGMTSSGSNELMMGCRTRSYAAWVRCVQVARSRVRAVASGPKAAPTLPPMRLPPGWRGPAARARPGHALDGKERPIERRPFPGHLTHQVIGVPHALGLPAHVDVEALAGADADLAHARLRRAAAQAWRWHAAAAAQPSGTQAAPPASAGDFTQGLQASTSPGGRHPPTSDAKPVPTG